jgi:hypothetical protein
VSNPTLSRRGFLGAALVAAIPTQVLTAESLLAGLGPRDIRVLSGPIGSGKTRLALQAALACANSTGKEVVFVRGRETPADLVEKVGGRQAGRLNHYFANSTSTAKRLGAWDDEPVGNGSVWIDDPLWLLEWDGGGTVAESFLQKRGAAQHLAIIDVFASEERVIRGVSYPAATADVLANYCMRTLELRVPRLLVVDTPEGSPLKLRHWTGEVGS